MIRRLLLKLEIAEDKYDVVTTLTPELKLDVSSKKNRYNFTVQTAPVWSFLL